MRRRHAGERVESYRRRLHRPEGEAIRQITASWARTVELEWPELPPGIEDRSADVWEALITIADAAGGDWPKQARNAAVALIATAKEAEPSLGLRLLSHVREVLDFEKLRQRRLGLRARSSRYQSSSFQQRSAGECRAQSSCQKPTASG